MIIKNIGLGLVVIFTNLVLGLSVILVFSFFSKSGGSNENVKNKEVLLGTGIVPPAKSLKFFVIGDWGRAGEYHQTEVANQMNKVAETFDPGFIISTGDNFYDNGVASIEDSQWNLSFEHVYKGANLQRDWFVVLGNHDYKGNVQAEIDYSKRSRRWNMPSRYYTNVKKINDSLSVRFIYIDTNPFVKSYLKKIENYPDLAKADTAKQLKWLDSVLINSKEKWKIVVGHHPLFSSSPEHGDTKELIPVLKPRFDKYKVNVYFSGHEHDLQLQKPSGTTDYIISGAGSETRKTGTYAITKFAKDISGFAALSITSDSMNLHFIDYNGKVIFNYKRGN